MNIRTKRTIKSSVLTLIFALASFLTLPAYAWPEVDHMNMCGPAAKSVRAYNGGFQGWRVHDNYVSKRGSGYYLKTMCPKTVAPVKKAYKKKVVKKTRIAKSSSAKKFKRTVKYDEHADCARVDRMNGYGAAVKAKSAYSPARVVAYKTKTVRKARPARSYNYFKK